MGHDAEVRFAENKRDMGHDAEVRFAENKRTCYVVSETVVLSS